MPGRKAIPPAGVLSGRRDCHISMCRLAATTCGAGVRCHRRHPTAAQANPYSKANHLAISALRPGGKTAHITMRNLRFCKPERPVLAARTARLPTKGKQPWQPPWQRRAEASAATWRNYSCLRRPTWHPQPRPAAKIDLRPPAAHWLAGPQTELNRAWRPGRQAWPCAAGRTACASRGQDAYR